MKYYFRYPKNLDIDALVERTMNASVKNKVKHKESILSICNSLINSMATKKFEIEDIGTKLYYPLSSKLLEIVVNKYKDYLDLLLQEGVIESDNLPVVGEKCTGFRFSDEYSGQKYRFYEVTNYFIKKAISKQKIKMLEESKQNTKGYHYLTKWLQSGKLKIDKVAAFKWIEDDRINELNKIELLTPDDLEKKFKEIINRRKKSKNVKKTKDINEYGNDDIKQLFINNINKRAGSFEVLVDNIYNNNYYYKFAGYGHRFYSPLSNLKRELRQFVTYDNKPLVNIDISNSQPFFAIKLHRLSFWENIYNDKTLFYNLNIKENDNKMKIYKDNRKYKNIVKEIIMFLESDESLTSKGFSISCLDSIDDLSDSVDYFVHLVSTGKFYEEIQGVMLPIFGERFNTREKVKKEVLRICYMENKLGHQEYYEPCIAFRGMFPVTDEIFYKLKSINSAFLANLLQWIESNIVIDMVSKRISMNHPTIPLFTIHDSILTTVGNEEIVKSIMAEIIEKEIGYAPKIKIEFSNPASINSTIQNYQYTSSSTESKRPKKLVQTSTRPHLLVDTNTGKVFQTKRQAAEELGINYNTFCNMTNGYNRNTSSLIYIKDANKNI